MSFKKIMDGLDSWAPEFIRKAGKLVNPYLVKFKNENNNLLVFYFHGLYISEEEKLLNHIDPQTNITVEEFNRFIEYFQEHNYRFILPEDIKKAGQENRTCAMITFDDGYFNNLLAIEVLNKYKIPALFFLSTHQITENKSFWWDIIYRNRRLSGYSLHDIRKEQASLKGYKHDYIEDYLVKNFGEKSLKPWSDIDRPFTPQEIKDLSSNPYVSFGNHTHNHSILTNHNKEEIIQEFEVCNKILQEWTGRKPESIAFPNGNYNQLVLDTARESGFEYVFTTEKGLNRLPLENPDYISLKRFITNATEIKEFGGFCRMNYDPQDYYYNLKIQTIKRLKFKK